MKEKCAKYFRIIIILLIVSSNIGCDQITKKMVRDRISPNEIINVIDNNLIFTKVENTGAALSIGENLSPLLKIGLLQIMPLAILLLMLSMIISNRSTSSVVVIAMCFIIGGGFGNVYDRVIYGSVTDFVFINLGVFKTGIFNMADVSVTVGTLMILGTMIFTKKLV